MQNGVRNMLMIAGVAVLAVFLEFSFHYMEVFKEFAKLDYKAILFK
ncbi:hypothetical protein [Niallia taxi]|nr:hypothetical protein [Niallia taxi]MED4041029.1 hypothetical protein [Niallia taxi]